MPPVFFYLAFILAVVAGTGAVLDKGEVRRPWRVLVWSALLLLGLPVSFVVFYVLVWVVYGDKYWFW